jgi:hypothetical protein
VSLRTLGMLEGLVWAALPVLLFVMLRALYRTGRRRGGGWWLATGLAGIALIACPPLGWMSWVFVVLIDRESPRDHDEARRIIEFPGADDPSFSPSRQHALGFQPPISGGRRSPRPRGRDGWTSPTGWPEAVAADVDTRAAGLSDDESMRPAA